MAATAAAVRANLEWAAQRRATGDRPAAATFLWSAGQARVGNYDPFEVLTDQEGEPW